MYLAVCFRESSQRRGCGTVGAFHGVYFSQTFTVAMGQKYSVKWMSREGLTLL